MRFCSMFGSNYSSSLKWEIGREKQIHRKSVVFFWSKTLHFHFIFIYEWLLQHNISYAIYLLLSMCILYLSVLDQSQIQNLYDGI